MKNFVVIGGQYQTYCYGAYKTLRGAMAAATRNKELWDNWQGWHTPKVYAARDCKYVDAGHFAPSGLYPVGDALPVAWHDGERWIITE